MSVKSVINNLYSVIDNPKSNKLITDELEVVELGRVKRIVLCVLEPLYSYFGKDVYSRYRASNITEKIKNYYKIHKKEIDQKDDLSLKIQDVFFKLGKESFFTLHEDDRRVSSKKIDTFPTIHKLPEDLNISSENRQYLYEKISQFFQNLSKYEGSFFIREKKGSSRINCKRKEPIRTYKLFCKDNDGRVRRLMRFNPSNSINFVIDNPNQVSVMTNEVIAEGGSAKVKKLFSPLSGNYYIKKPIDVKDSISKSVNAFTCGKIGFLPEIYFRTPEPTKQQYIQLKYDSDLRKAILNNTIPLAEVPKIVADLLTGLSILHNCTTPITINGVSSQLRGSHCDIKPENILVKKGQNGSFDAAFIDISLGQAILHGTFTPGFCSPDRIFPLVDLNRNLINGKVVCDHLNRYGAAGDMWSMGLTIFTLLLGNFIITTDGKEEGYVFDSYFRKKLNPDNISKFSKDLTQEQVTNLVVEFSDFYLSKINEITDKPLGNQLANIWNAANAMMKVDPNMRITAAQALEKIST
ncbi:MAG: hypothetical protein ChlgKO_11730 [Chlamydiales bacterium]